MIYTKNSVGKKAEINLHHNMFLWCLFRNDVIIAAAVSCRAVRLQLPLTEADIHFGVRVKFYSRFNNKGFNMSLLSDESG